MLFTILGGLGTLLGPILGAGIVEYSNLYLVEFITGLGLPGEIWLVVLGVIYIFIVLFMPLGIIGSIKSRARPLKEKLQRLKIGRYEFGIKESDYWVFAFLGIVAVFLLMLIISL
jgi:branched-chain amino acid transport system permease protein